MAYHVDITPHVLEYLTTVDGLTEEDRATVIDGITEELSQNADYFHALHPLSHESLCFRYAYPHPTPAAVYDFDFIVSAHHLAAGVVIVAYVEVTRHPTT